MIFRHAFQGFSSTLEVAAQELYAPLAGAQCPLGRGSVPHIRSSMPPAFRGSMPLYLRTCHPRYSLCLQAAITGSDFLPVSLYCGSGYSELLSRLLLSHPGSFATPYCLQATLSNLSSGGPRFQIAALKLIYELIY